MDKNQEERIFYMTGPDGQTYRVPESRVKAFTEMLERKKKEQREKET